MWEVIGIWLFIYGWMLLWPAARLVFKRPPDACAVLRWVFIIGVILEAAGHAYVFHLHWIGNQDWWMAWLLPQIVAMLAWVVSLAGLIVAINRTDSQNKSL